MTAVVPACVFGAQLHVWGKAADLQRRKSAAAAQEP